MKPFELTDNVTNLSKMKREKKEKEKGDSSLISHHYVRSNLSSLLEISELSPFSLVTFFFENTVAFCSQYLARTVKHLLGNHKIIGVKGG